eukprot:scaffold2758_cov59-Phaeocystis_antarctica.AAC.1
MSIYGQSRGYPAASDGTVLLASGSSRGGCGAAGEVRGSVSVGSLLGSAQHLLHARLLDGVVAGIRCLLGLGLAPAIGG